jgi:hypothetical protein
MNKRVAILREHKEKPQPLAREIGVQTTAVPTPALQERRVPSTDLEIKTHEILDSKP